jgi:hypothetical protein
MCKESLTINEARKIHEMLPYVLRLHEIEAYMKQDSVADEIRKVIGSEIETIIRGLDATLQPPLNEVAKQLSEISNLSSNSYTVHINYLYYSDSFLKQFVENLLNRFVGIEALALKIAKVLSTIKDEDVRERILRELNINEFISSCASTLAFALPQKCWNESVGVKSIIITPVQVYDKPRPKAFIVTNAGFAISFTLAGEAPLAAIVLRPLNKLPLLSLSQYLNSLRDTNLLHLANRDRSSDFIAYIYTNVNEQEILKEIAKEMKRDERKQPDTIEKLICMLAPVLGGENTVVERLTIQDLGTELIRVRSIMKNSMINEVLLCGGKAGVGNKELDKERVVKSLLNPDSADKEFVEAFKNYINGYINKCIKTEILKRINGNRFGELLEKIFQEIEKEQQLHVEIKK